MAYCKFCNKELKYLGSHERCCKLNPSRNIWIEKLKKSSEIAKKMKCSSEQFEKYESKLIEKILAHNGKLLTKYNGYKVNIKIECCNGHIWNVIPYNVIRGCWCPECHKLTLNDPKTSMSEIHDLAKSKDGHCLSSQYIPHKKLHWRCKYNHEWYSLLENIKTGSWCQSCSEGLSERICRNAFEMIFNKKFPKVRLASMRSKRNRPLELDGYCAELNIAFEHNGTQHYKKRKDSSEKNFLHLQENDETKISYCKNNGIKLIVIPELFIKTKTKNLMSFIKNECIALGVELPSNYDSLDANIDEAYSSNSNEIKINELRKNLLDNGLLLLTRVFNGCQSKIDVKCEKCNVIYKISLINSQIRRSCKFCSRSKLVPSIYLANKIAQSHGGKCLSTAIINQESKLTWQCEQNHIWENKYRYVKRGVWCKICRLQLSKNKKK